jgi:fructose-bisphosphate aldolase class II
MRVSPLTLFEQCYGRYAIAAVNVFCMEQVLALFEAAEKANAPFIVQLTPYARDYAHPRMLAGMIEAAADIYPNTVFAVHLDHGTEPHCLDAIPTGHYDSVMIDASHDPFEKNVACTRRIVEAAHRKGIAVEAELGVLEGVEDDAHVDAESARYTDPDQCREFVERTGCDSLAVAVGTSHGAYKFAGSAGLQFHLLEAIQQRLPRFPLVLHGASAVDLAEIERINRAGGQLKAGARGVSPEEIRQAIPSGVCKINIATDTRLSWTRVHREFFRDHPDQIDLVVPGKTYRKAYVDLMLAKFDLLGATGQADTFDQR